MKTFKIKATYIEYIQEQEIKAKNVEEAKEIYRDKWNNGDLLVGSSDFQVEVI